MKKVRTIGFGTWKQHDKWHYEIREGDPLRGKMIKSGKDYPTKTKATSAMNYQLRKMLKKK
jgi:hypothetical protein